MDTIGDRLRALIRAKGLMVKEAAEQLGVTREHLHYVMKYGNAGKRLAERIEAWSGGIIRREEVVFPDTRKSA